MNVICPDCRTTYRVDPRKVPVGGVIARCARCPAEFLVSTDTAEERAWAGAEVVESRPVEGHVEVGNEAVAAEIAAGTLLPDLVGPDYYDPGQQPVEIEAAVPETESGFTETAAYGSDVTPDALPEESAEGLAGSAVSFESAGAGVDEESRTDEGQFDVPGLESDLQPEAEIPAEPVVAHAVSGEEAEAATADGGWDAPPAGSERHGSEYEEARGSAGDAPMGVAADSSHQDEPGSDLEAEPTETAETVVMVAGEETPEGFVAYQPRTAREGDGDGASTGAPAADEPLPPPPFGTSDPHARARRLARALVSDIVVYYPDRRERSMREGTLRREFREEIRKSWDEYVANVGEQMARDTTYFRDALNDLLAGGAQVF